MPETITALKGRDKGIALSRFARKSAKASAIKSNLDVGIFEKNDSGVPIPSKGIYWSVSHKPCFVAGVVSREKIGIDIEQVKKVSDALFERIIDLNEAELFNSQTRQIVFFRGFTAKEAVLKKTFAGIKGLSKVKIKAVLDEKNLVVEYLDNQYLVENFYFDGYLASVTKDHFEVHWIMV